MSILEVQVNAMNFVDIATNDDTLSALEQRTKTAKYAKLGKLVSNIQGKLRSNGNRLVDMTVQDAVKIIKLSTSGVSGAVNGDAVVAASTVIIANVASKAASSVASSTDTVGTSAIAATVKAVALVVVAMVVITDAEVDEYASIYAS